MPDAGVPVEVLVNDTLCRRTVPPRMSPADFLRDDVLGLTGTHLGCEHV